MYPKHNLVCFMACGASEPVTKLFGFCLGSLCWFLTDESREPFLRKNFESTEIAE